MVVMGTLASRPAKIMIDSGSSDNFVAKSWIEREQLKTNPWYGQVRLADGTRRDLRERLVPCQLRLQGYQTTIEPIVADISDYHIILGRPWLNAANPDVDWASNLITVKQGHRQFRLEALGDEEPKIQFLNAMQFERQLAKDEELCLLLLREPSEEKDNHLSPQATALVQSYPDVFPNELPKKAAPQAKRGPPNRVGARTQPTVPATLSSFPTGIGGAQTTIGETLGRWLHSSKCVAIWSTHPLCAQEGWFATHVCGLPATQQDHHQE
jgi:hypothetical protein